MIKKSTKAWFTKEEWEKFPWWHKINYIGIKPDVSVGEKFSYSTPNNHWFRICVFLRKWATGYYIRRIWFPAFKQRIRRLGEKFKPKKQSQLEKFEMKMKSNVAKYIK
jgi:hypothetical protein